jgi:hypothetical protein
MARRIIDDSETEGDGSATPLDVSGATSPSTAPTSIHAGGRLADASDNELTIADSNNDSDEEPVVAAG